MKTTTLKKSEFKKEWHVLDATDISVGRLASRVSLILKGKNKPQFSPNLPVGDGVIIARRNHSGQYLPAKRLFEGRKAEIQGRLDGTVERFHQADV